MLLAPSNKYGGAIMLYKLYQAYKITKEENVIEEKEVLILNYGGFGANLLHKPMHIVIEEIDDSYLEYLTPITEHKYKPLINADIFEDIDKSKLRLRKPKSGTPPKGPTEAQLKKLRRLKPVKSSADKNFNLKDANLSVGSLVEHVRFGKGKIVKIEGVGADTKAEIDFENGGLKKLLLRFAKLNVIE